MNKEIVFWGPPSLWGKKSYMHICEAGSKSRLQLPGLQWSKSMQFGEALLLAKQSLEELQACMIGAWEIILDSDRCRIWRLSFWARDNATN